jgi:hypothetical protein
VEAPSVDLKTQIIALREHSAYQARLAIELNSLLTTAEHALAEPQSETIQGAEQIAEVLQLFSKEADLFCERIKVFLATPQQTNNT